MMSRRDRLLQDIVKTLQIYHDNVDEADTPADDSTPSQKEILQHLMEFLNGS
jgi:beta-catenin-like protein 1